MTGANHPFDLAEGARQAMLDAGFLPDLPAQARKEAAALGPARPGGPGVRDLRALPWSSIDNDESRDLDQIEVAERLARRPRPGPGRDRRRRRARAAGARRSIAYAASEHVHRSTPASTIFPMLPESLSTGSHVAWRRRRAPRGRHRDGSSIRDGRSSTRADVYRAARHEPREARLRRASARGSTGRRPARPRSPRAAGSQEQLRLQDAAAQSLQRLRHERGALDLETIEARAGRRRTAQSSISSSRRRAAPATLIEDFMIAANGAMARFLEARGRLVDPARRARRRSAGSASSRSPSGLGDELPAEPSSMALSGVPRAPQRGRPRTRSRTCRSRS